MPGAVLVLVGGKEAPGMHSRMGDGLTPVTANFENKLKHFLEGPL